jgi:signal transduction histidine kinase
LLAIGAIIFILVRKIGRTFAPLAQIIDAADRVAAGDYSVRVNGGGGPPEMRGMVEAFNIMTTRLEVNEEQRKHLLSDIAHELRTPLAVVQGTIEGMIDDVYPKDTAHLAPLLDQTQLIARLLNDLQTVATAEAGVLGLHHSLTSLGDLVIDTATSFAPVASHKGVALTTDVIDRVEIEIDPVRIRQVLDNLLTNALRYTDAGGSIVIGFRVSGKWAEITVRDSGRGMAPEDAARMFERFVKSADSGGSGLGLAIAKSLVEAHGGTIGAESTPGEGTTVTIRLPLPE